MRTYHLLACCTLCFTLNAGTIATDTEEAEVWLKANEADVSDVNEGELEFFATPPRGGPFHHHQNRLTITPESLGSGWVAFEQCHDHLDAVPRMEIAFREGRARSLKITRASGIGKAWVEAHSVQLEDIAHGAQLCLTGELRLITRLGNNRHMLQSGPYMRRFLDGYYPMKVSLGVFPKGLSGTIELVDPKPQAGFTVAKVGDALHITALFAGRLLIELEITNRRFE